MFEEKTIEINDLTFSYAEGPPAGPTLVLLHGLFSRWQSFLSIIPLLATRWHIFALDLRGHGQSSWADDAYTLDHYADDVQSFIDRRVGEPAAIYGHSLGGMVGIIVAARRPLRALIIGDSPLYRDTIQSMYGRQEAGDNPVQALVRSGKSVAELARALRDVIPGRDAIFYRYHAKSCHQLHPEVFIPMGERIGTYDVDVLFPRISCPVLLMQADHISETDVVRARSQLDDLTVIQFNNVSHELQNDLAGYSVGLAVAKFLESLG